MEVLMSSGAGEESGHGMALVLLRCQRSTERHPGAGVGGVECDGIYLNRRL